MNSFFTAVVKAFYNPIAGPVLYLIGTYIWGCIIIMWPSKKVRFTFASIFVVVVSMGVVFINPVAFFVIMLWYIVAGIVILRKLRTKIELKVIVRLGLGLIALALILLVVVILHLEYEIPNLFILTLLGA